MPPFAAISVYRGDADQIRSTSCTSIVTIKWTVMSSLMLHCAFRLTSCYTGLVANESAIVSWHLDLVNFNDPPQSA